MIIESSLYLNSKKTNPISDTAPLIMCGSSYISAIVLTVVLLPLIWSIVI